MQEFQPELSYRASTLLDFWFATDSPSERDRLRDVWFRATPDFDAALAEQFRADYDRASAGAYVSWRTKPDTSLALVLLLDQFPRNLFRNSPRAYATDAFALEVAAEAVAGGFDQEFDPMRRCFFYMPFQHSEKLSDQKLALHFFGALPEHPDKVAFVAAAQQHYAIIARFRRFPHRNAILGRTSTPEEAAFLLQSGSSFWATPAPAPGA